MLDLHGTNGLDHPLFPTTTTTKAVQQRKLRPPGLPRGPQCGQGGRRRGPRRVERDAGCLRAGLRSAARRGLRDGALGRALRGEPRGGVLGHERRGGLEAVGRRGGAL